MWLMGFAWKYELGLEFRIYTELSHCMFDMKYHMLDTYLLMIHHNILEGT